jgi:uncharacterized protein YkwD
MSFWKRLHDTFIPHPDNGYKPHFFSVQSVLIIMIVVAALGIGAIVLQKTVIENSDYLAAVIESTVINLTNTDRASNNLAYLSENPLLDRAAQMKADDMAKNSYFAHTSPGGVTPWHWFKESGYAFAYAGENLAIRFSDSVDVERAWMNSPTHRANILSPHFTEIGVGIAQGIYEGQPTIFVVQEFGTPAAKTAYPEFLTTKNVNEPNASSTAPVATASTTKPKVEGASAETIPEPTPKVIVQNDTFIAVKNEVATNSPLAIAPTTDGSQTLVQKVVTSPRSVVAAIYLLLAAIITLALIVMIVIEIRHQHPKNVALGVLLILLMVGLLWAGQILVPGSLAIL